MNNISQFDRCSGCGACTAVCSTNAIQMTDSGLFYFPQVDEAKCINCGACVQVCPVNTPKEKSRIRSAWAGVHKNQGVVKRSSSGGVFSALAQVILGNGGTVFGACYNADCSEVILTGTHRVPVDALRKSKYVESRSADAFQEAELQLQQGKQVLFCGAPCQIAGLKRYLGIPYDNLVTCDFTCGGMPSHKLYQNYLKELEKRHNAKPISVDFRPKTVGWENHAIRIRFSNGKEYHKLAKMDPYLFSYIYAHSCIKEICMECPFADNHSSDIILADFWKHREFSGWEKSNNGISLILATTEKGEKLLRMASETVTMEQLDLEEAAYNIKKPHYTKESKLQRESFLTQWAKEGLWSAAKTIGMPSGIGILKTSAKVYLRYLRELVR